MAKKPASPITTDLIAQLDRKLAPLGRVRARRMFSGYVVYLDVVVFALLLRGKVWLRVDDATRPDFAKAGMKPFSYTRPSSALRKTLRARRVRSRWPETAQAAFFFRAGFFLLRSALARRASFAQRRSLAPSARTAYGHW